MLTDAVCLLNFRRQRADRWNSAVDFRLINARQLAQAGTGQLDIALRLGEFVLHADRVRRASSTEAGRALPLLTPPRCTPICRWLSSTSFWILEIFCSPIASSIQASAASLCRRARILWVDAAIWRDSARKVSALRSRLLLLT